MRMLYLNNKLNSVSHYKAEAKQTKHLNVTTPRQQMHSNVAFDHVTPSLHTHKLFFPTDNIIQSINKQHITCREKRLFN